jgi:electron transport complex protein RnfC
MFGRHSFRHGVHPPPQKTTRDHAIRRFPFAPLLKIPLLQHAGRPAIPVVCEGEEVQRGQLLARADGELSAPLHAPASGRVRSLASVLSLSGARVPGVYLEPFPASTQEVIEGTPCDVENATPEEILTAIQQAGIVGLGGAAFPTHVKLRVPLEREVDTLLINGVECEPYLTTDYRVMREQTEDVVRGIRYLQKATGVTQAVLAVENHNRDVLSEFETLLPADLDLKLISLDVKYPQGAEKILIHSVLGRQVPSGGLPSDVGAVCINVATTAEIGRLLPHGRGIQERVITIAGSAVAEPGNYRIPIGTPLDFLLDTVGAKDNVGQVFFGGPMMGQAAPSLDVAVTKGTSGIVALEGYHKPAPVYPCIRCSRCVEACPMYLNPAQLGLLARRGEHELAEAHHLFDCFECGACAYVCPSHLPLVQEFRSAKAALRRQAQYA